MQIHQTQPYNKSTFIYSKVQPKKTKSMSLAAAAQVLRDLGELGIHLDKVGDLLIEQKR